MSTRSKVALLAVAWLCAGVILGLALGRAAHGDSFDCRPTDYHDGGWYNPSGQLVAVAPSEDSVMHYVGPCA